jgi:hypothetical protein
MMTRPLAAADTDDGAHVGYVEVNANAERFAVDVRQLG